MENEIVTVDIAPASIEHVQAQMTHLHRLMRDVLRDGTHYGKIPGCGPKPALYKPGAEKLCMMFRLIPFFKWKEKDQGNNHKEYVVTCSLKDPRGNIVGQGLGSCSTLESKYRYRGSELKNTGELVPKEYWELFKTDKKAALESIGGAAFTIKKADDGRWYIHEKGGKIENPDIADQYNTVLKMAKKRAHVDATITTLSASDIFTQDVEEVVIDYGKLEKEQEKEKKENIAVGEYYYDIRLVPVERRAEAEEYCMASGMIKVQGVYMSTLPDSKLAKYLVPKPVEDDLPGEYAETKKGK